MTSDNEMIEKIMHAIVATSPEKNEGLAFSYGQIERGLQAILALPELQGSPAEREAVRRVGNQFHRTRLMHDVHVDPEDLYLVLKAAGYYSDTPPSSGGSDA